MNETGGPRRGTAGSRGDGMQCCVTAPGRPRPSPQSEGLERTNTSRAWAPESRGQGAAPPALGGPGEGLGAEVVSQVLRRGPGVTHGIRTLGSGLQVTRHGRKTGRHAEEKGASGDPCQIVLGPRGAQCGWRSCPGSQGGACGGRLTWGTGLGGTSPGRAAQSPTAGVQPPLGSE